MNSSSWAVRAGDARYVLKVSNPSDRPGLDVAAWLQAAGIRTGAPERTAIRGGRLIALLRFVDGRQLEVEDARRIGETLGRVHTVLRDAPVPADLVRWPWPFLDHEVIAEPDLRAAAKRAIERADAVARSVTHGILHGDPAPEAFIERDGEVGLIDWGAACHGPLLFDLASAWLYTGQSADLMDGYRSTGPIPADELEHLAAFLAFRWALQACYFSERISADDLTGLADASENEKGLADARAFLMGR